MILQIANCFITLGPVRFHAYHFFLYFLLIFGYTPFLSSDSVLLILVWKASAFSFKCLLLSSRSCEVSNAKTKKKWKLNMVDFWFPLSSFIYSTSRVHNSFLHMSVQPRHRDSSNIQTEDSFTLLKILPNAWNIFLSFLFIILGSVPFFLSSFVAHVLLTKRLIYLVIVERNWYHQRSL